MDLYENLRIDLAEPTIRLLRLYSGNFEDDIRCDLFNGSFDKPETMIPYAALSYVWGSNEKLARVLVNNIKVQITSNLDTALRYLRSKKIDLILWVDAICIDQNSNNEKNHQIKQMGNIYNKADEVVIWLGEGNEDSDFTMDAMIQFGQFSLYWEGDWRSKAKNWVLYQRSFKAGYGKRLIAGMNELLRRSWYRRIWILQEVANARTATVHCGRFFVSTQTFAQFPSIIRTTATLGGSQFHFEIPSHCQSVLDIMPGLSRKESWWEKDRSLCTLISKFRESEATDDRDKIYALIGISSDARNSTILDPDYHKSLGQVIADTASFILYPSTKQEVSLYEPLRLQWGVSEFSRKVGTATELSSAIFEHLVESGQLEMAKVLLRTVGFMVNSKNDRGDTPIHLATLISQTEFDKIQLTWDYSYRKHLSYEEVEKLQKDFSDAIIAPRVIIKLLLDNGADIEAKYFNGETPLLLAMEGWACFFAQLLSYRATVEAKGFDSIDDNTMLLYSAVRKELEANVQQLVRYGADVEAKDIVGNTPLLVASAQLEAGPTCQLLLDKGANIEAKDIAGNTPLLVAVRGGLYPTCQLLIDKGADIEAKNSNGETAL